MRRHLTFGEMDVLLYRFVRDVSLDDVPHTLRR